MAKAPITANLSNDSWYEGPIRKFGRSELDTPIGRLQPESDHAAWVLNQLCNRIRASEDEMKSFYDRWRVAEKKHQAYLNLPKYEQMLKDMNNKGKPPAPSIIVFPYCYAVNATTVTYMMRAFCGRKPIISLGVTSPESADSVREMETILQYNFDEAMALVRLHQFFMDGELYGVAAMRNIWVVDQAMRSVWRQPTPAERMVGARSPMMRAREMKTVFEGNELTNIDPFMLFPDPTVPLMEAPRQGEYIFYRQYLSRINLIMEQNAGRISYLEHAKPMASGRDYAWSNLSNRNLLAGGQAHAGDQRYLNRRGLYEPTFQYDEGSILLIPSDWGLWDQDEPQRVLFGILNKNLIVKCVPLDNDHGEHPMIMAEPYSAGYSFGSPSSPDYIGPIQDIMSWFLDSHIYNIRAHLQNMIIYDPSRIEGADIKRPGPGKLIRMKASAVGQDVRTAIHQLQLNDVTRGHISDMNTFMQIGDTISAINDNLRGMPDPGGRKTATEVRASGEAGLQRLGIQAMMYSAQGITRLARQMVLNIQQYQTAELYLKVLGSDAAKLIRPQALNGNFIYPAHDGTLPLDKVAMLQVWERILFGIAQDPEMRANYSLPRIFEYVAELGGAINISHFRTGIVADPSQAPGMVPLQQAAGALPQPGGFRPPMPAGPAGPAPQPGPARPPGRPVPPIRGALPVPQRPTGAPR